jgi:hypothetical protein
MSGYAGAGQAGLCRSSEQQWFWQNETLAVGELSVGWQLQRVTSMYYPWGFAVEVQFTAAPGAFEIDVMGAETDAQGNYVKLGSITAVNSSNVGRFDNVTSYYPRYVALYVTSLTNASTVKVSAKVTR